jgi:hypothetical protein
MRRRRGRRRGWKGSRRMGEHQGKRRKRSEGEGV